jgi:hypothetical protein
MSKSKRLIDLHLSGKSARHVIEALVEELPPVFVIKQSVLKDLPKGSEVTIDENVVYIICNDKRALVEKVPYFELMYPELDFVAKTRKK